MSDSIILYSDTHFHNHPQFGGPRVPEGVSVYDETGDNMFPGCNQRAVALLDATREMFRYAVKNDITHLFHLGDVFHSKGHVPVAVSNAVSKVFRNGTEQGLKLYVFPGNHDLVGKSENWTSLHTLYTMPHVQVSQAPDVKIIPVGPYKLAVASIPYMASKATFLEALQKAAGTIKEMTSNGEITHSILLMHTSVEGAVTGPHEYVMREGVALSELPLGIFDGLFSGHFHKHQEITSKKGRLVYVGGIAQHDFGEREYIPGFLKVALKDRHGIEYEQIENILSPRFHSVDVENEHDLAILFGMFANSCRDYCRVVWSGGRLPNGLKIPENVSMDTGVNPVESKPRMEVSMVDDSPQALIKRYVQYKNPRNVDHDRLVSVGLELLNE